MPRSCPEASEMGRVGTPVMAVAGERVWTAARSTRGSCAVLNPEAPGWGSPRSWEIAV